MANQEERAEVEYMRPDGIGEDSFRLAIEASPAAMIMTNRLGVVEFANAETERMFGHPKGELIGQSIDLLVPARLRGNHSALRQGFFADPSKRPMGVGRDLRGTRKDGTEFPVEIGLTPIETKSGLIVLATVVDITARREAENALAQRASELESANARLLQFAYVASHDLQEPLRKIAAFADLLEEAVTNANQADINHATKVIRSSALRARELIDDLLSFSRAVNREPQFETLDLREEIELALTDLSGPINETRARINIIVAGVAIRADRSQFARLMQNIVSNAIKYRKPGEVPTIEISAVPTDLYHVRLAIADDGIGFEEKYAQEIFEPFKRLHSKVDYPGTGIGLAICKTISDRYGWGIAVKSQLGLGTTFCITLQTVSSRSRGNDF
jgi:PAS domain S-box-containing protein